MCYWIRFRSWFGSSICNSILLPVCFSIAIFCLYHLKYVVDVTVLNGVLPMLYKCFHMDYCDDNSLGCSEFILRPLTVIRMLHQ